MKLTYICDHKKITTDVSNGDVTITSSNDGHRQVVSIKANRDIVLETAKIVLDNKANYKDRYFLNGYQSWTDTREFKLNNRLRNIKKSPHIITHMFAMNKYGDSTFYRYSIKKVHGYDIFYSRGKDELFLYNLNYHTAYLIIELTKQLKKIILTSDVHNIALKAGEEITVFDFKLFTGYENGLENFYKDFPYIEKEKLFGYSSWYNYYQNINEEIILRDLDALDNRFDVFQIDDGYETFVGDWLNIDPVKFPNGFKDIVNKIHSKGFKAGIWLAPFVAETKSELFQMHPDWFKKDQKGHLIKAGGNWSGFYALDLSKNEVRDYIKECLTYYMDLGFDFFKLDFLYAVGLDSYEGKSRCQVQDEAYQFIRDVLKDKLILGCGANIINSTNKFDYLRVGPDVSLQFDDVWFMRLFHRERISTKVTLQNTIYRSFMDHHLFANDPDVFLLRDENMKLSGRQRQSLGVINALFGSLMMTSDNLSTYNKEKQEGLSMLLDVFYHATDKSFRTVGKFIEFSFRLNEKKHTFRYNTKKGELKYVG